MIVGGRAVRSCVTPRRAPWSGAEITTLEGLGTPKTRIRIQQAFIDEQAMQCGFCVNGVIMTAKALLDQNAESRPTREIQQAMSGVLCRCSTHVRMFQAIRRYAQRARRRMMTPTVDSGRARTRWPRRFSRRDFLKRPAR